MNDVATTERYVQMTTPDTLKIERLLPGPKERVWAYLTDSEQRRKWLAAGKMEMKVGAAFEFVWRNDELTDPPGKRPADFSSEHRMQSRITELDVPNTITFTWGESGLVTFDLASKGDEVLLTVTHRRLPARPSRLLIAAGWHMHLDVLEARATGEKPAPFWDGWTALRNEYNQRLPE
jgi:uncharacterized protein YndB with AHSA1/START domain